MEVDYNPLEPQVRANPYPHYAALRDEAPVCWVPSIEAYAVSRYEDVVSIFKNPRLFSSRRGHAQRALLEMLEQRSETLARALRMPSLVTMDPPRHARSRNLVNRAFTSRRIAALEPHIRDIARQLISAMLSRRECELMTDLASPLPVTVIAELLGVEPGRREDFRRWSNTVVSTAPLLLRGADPAPFEAAFSELDSYLQGVIEERRRAPQDDLISVLVQRGEQAEVLTPEELRGFVRLLLIAGNETTTNLLGNAMVALLAHPEQMALLRREPARIPDAIEEALRYDSPAQAMFRTPVEDVDIAGVTVPADTFVLPLIGSANRDPRVFDDPDRFDMTREQSPGHLAFGYGIHFCLGAPLARLEARVVYEELLAATRDIAYAPGQADNLRWADSFVLRGPKELRLRIEPA